MKFWLVAVVAGVVASLGAANGEEKLAASVRALEVQIELAKPTGPEKPLELKAADDLQAAVADKAEREKLAALVDFAKESLVVFQWDGSGQDKITPSEELHEGQNRVWFTYQRGLTRDLRQHLRVFAVSKETPWAVRRAERFR